jgi:hypothetical protein
MNVPSLYSPESVATITKEMLRLVNGRWVACRPLGYQGFRLLRRLKLAYLVFTGKADVVKWEQQ